MVFLSIGNSRLPAVECSNTACCTFSAEILCMKSGFDSWMVTLPLLDQKSLFLDINLLRELLKSVLVGPDEAYQVGTLIEYLDCT